MSPRSADTLSQVLVRLRLLTPPQANEAMTEVGPRHADADDLIEILERRNLLTSYQSSQLRRGETDALVLGGCKLLYRNASGSFARVYRAESIADGRMVGVKLLRQRWANDPQTVSQFHREAELCKRLRHKNIVPIYDVGRQNSHHFFTMEFVEGGNLKDFINIRGKLSPEEATRYARDMAEALEYALRQGITHRDMKLTNVLLSTEGVAKLVDFGLAGNDGIQALGDDEASQRALEYAAIEKGTGAPENDPRSDLFFLGAIYYELLTGVPPYPRTRSRDERRRLTRYSNLRPLTDVEPDVPEDVARIVARLLMINPNERYQSPSELITDLRVVQAGGTSHAVAEDEHPPTVLCIENRPKQQDILRTYLAKHGFRVLLLGDVHRALNRLKTNPPDCVVMMGPAVGSDIASAYDTLVQISRRTSLTGILVLSRQQSHLEEACAPTGSTRVMMQPVTMRQLRKQIQHLFQVKNAPVKSFIIDDDTDESAVARV